MELAAEAEVGGKAMLRTKAIATTGFMGEMVAMRTYLALLLNVWLARSYA